MSRYRPARRAMRDALAQVRAQAQAVESTAIGRRYEHIESTLPSCGCAGLCRHWTVGPHRYGQIGASLKDGVYQIVVPVVATTRRIDMASGLSRPRVLGPRSPTGLPK